MREPKCDFPFVPERLPGRLSANQAAAVLGFQPHDIRVLVSARLLKPLGNPPAGALKFFAAGEVADLAADRAWLAKATNAIYHHWHSRNHMEEPVVSAA